MPLARARAQHAGCPIVPATSWVPLVLALGVGCPKAQMLSGAGGPPAWGGTDVTRSPGPVAGDPGWRFSAGLSSTLIASRNPRYSLGVDLGSDTVLQVTPALVLTANDGVISGQAQYQPDLYVFARAPDSHDVRHTLRSTWRADLVKDRLTVDAALLHGQQTLSAFAAPAITASPGATTVQGAGAFANLFNRNVTSVTTAQIAPTFSARLAGVVDASVRYQRSHIDMQNAPNGSQDADAWQLRLGGGAVLPWSLTAVQQIQAFESGRVLRSQGVYALASRGFVPEFTGRISAGVERRNFESSIGPAGSGRSTPYLQAGLSWTPDSRTAVSLDLFDRYFGAGWQILASHRTGRMAWRLASGRTVVDGVYSLGALSSQVGVGTSMAAGDLYNQLLAVQEPDGLKRQILVSQALQARGLQSQSPISGISGSQGPNLQTRLEIGWIYTLPRQTLSLLGLRTQSERVLKDPLNPSEDLARFGGVTQHALQMALSHRLTPEANLVLSATTLRTQASRLAQPTALDQIALTLSARAGSASTVGLSIRQGRYRNANLVAAAGTATGPATSIVTDGPGAVAASRQDTSLALLLSTRF